MLLEQLGLVWLDGHLNQYTKSLKNQKPPTAAFAAFVCECYLITDKHTESLVCIPCVMVLLLHSASRAQISTATCQTFDLDL